MKKLIYIIASLSLIAFASSCKKEVPAASTLFQNVVIDVPQASWEYSSLPSNNFFVATVEMPEITEKIFDGGLIKMYRLYDYNNINATQIELPYVRMKEEELSNGEWVFYTEQVDYEIKIGKIQIFYTVSDFDYEINTSFVPEAMQFRCVVVY